MAKGNRERGTGNGERGTGNGERGMIIRILIIFPIHTPHLPTAPYPHSLGGVGTPSSPSPHRPLSPEGTPAFPTSPSPHLPSPHFRIQTRSD
jgi:hypothetical protein